MTTRQRTRIAQQKAILGALVALGLVLGYAVCFGQHGLRRYLGLRATLAERSNDAYERIVRNRSLGEQIESVQHDDRALEELARSRLGVVGQDEVVYVFPDQRPRY